MPMRFMILIKATKDSEAGVMPSERLLTEMGNFNEELVKAGVMLAGEGLQPTSKGARVKFTGGQRTVIDGPFAETKELIAGFWLWQCKSLQEAIDWVKRCPNPYNEDGEVEIRPVFEAEDFGAEFTPELRKQEAGIRAQTLGLGEVRFERTKEMLLAGLRGSYTIETRGKIPAQWERFAPSIGKVPGQIGEICYGVCWNMSPERGFDYLSGVQVTDTKGLPSEFATVRLAAREYAVFAHRDHVSAIDHTLDKIWREWVPQAGLKVASAPCFERYGKEFDPQTGMGGMEIWIPLDA
jgi:AraC family transcriptional regulator